MKVPGMLSARSVRAAVVGATLKSIDKSFHVVMQGPQADGRTAANAYRSLRQEYWRR